MYNWIICNEHHSIMAQLDHIFTVLFLKFCYITDVLQTTLPRH